jgi:hypothetical protein
MLFKNLLYSAGKILVNLYIKKVPIVVLALILICISLL